MLEYYGAVAGVLSNSETYGENFNGVKIVK
jgi:hypothetical protein